MLGRFMTTSLLPTSVKCTTAVQWWLSNSILQFSWRKLTHSIWGRAGVKNTPDRRICLVAWLNLVFQSRHLSLWTIAGRPDCQLTHSNGAFFSSQSTLYSGNISLLHLSVFFSFWLIFCCQVPLLVRWDRSFSGFDPPHRTFQRSQEERRYPHLCQGSNITPLSHQNCHICSLPQEVLPSGEEAFLGTLTLPRGTSIALWLDAVHSLSFAQPSQVLLHFPFLLHFLTLLKATNS